MTVRPPSRRGVGASTVALPEGEWTRVFDFLIDRFPRVPREEWSARFERGDILNEVHEPIRIDAPFIAHTKVHYFRHIQGERRIPFEERILFQDEWLVVADKPHFLPVLSTGGYVQESLLVRLKDKLSLPDLAPLHRIDRETAGLVLFAVQPSTRGRYMELFRRRSISKAYEAIAAHRQELILPLTVRNRLEKSEIFMQMHAVDGEPNSETHFELMHVQGAAAKYSIKPVTGKRHQIRVHMAGLGIPILNDRIYPELKPALETDEEWNDSYRRPLQLLAKRVEFKDPILGIERQFESKQALDW
jgi:tRNA pseudouridine32 synthase/23S rRNA pseudouridine746 synthase